MTDKALLQECYDQLRIMFNPDVPLMQKLTARLAQCERCGEVNPAEIHTCSPKREWVGLTDEEIEQTIWKELGIGKDDDEIAEFARAIEAKLKEKNG